MDGHTTWYQAAIAALAAWIGLSTFRVFGLATNSVRVSENLTQAIRALSEKVEASNRTDSEVKVALENMERRLATIEMKIDSLYGRR